jgi:hypothetical protein
MVALTLALIAVATQRAGRSTWTVAGWVLLALFFGYMAMDDGTAFHERLGSGVQNRLGLDELALGDELVSPLTAFPSYGWQLVLLPLMAAVGVFMVIFLRLQFGKSGRLALVLGGLALFAIAVGFDFVEGLDREHPWNLHVRLEESLDQDEYTVRHFAKSLEEFMEMFGTTLLWIGFLAHFMQSYPIITAQFLRKEAGASTANLTD